ncbi:MAG: amidohydrolase family protein, partial [Alphaproteobacteria bacterium]|nr:amidohydrolase family protein [Alphaproteobacteria bacterium]
TPAGAIYFQIDEMDMQRILAYPPTMIGSDGLPHDKHPHPRLWGTFPRVLGHYCRDLGLFDLETAVHKMTGLPAETFGLKDRGVVREGAHADLVVFDADKIRDLATYEQPLRQSLGIDYVLVNGTLSLTLGNLCPDRAGQVVGRH